MADDLAQGLVEQIARRDPGGGDELEHHAASAWSIAWLWQGLFAAGGVEDRALAGTAEDRALTRASLPSVMFDSSPGAPAMGPGAAMRVADVRACVRLIAGSIACLPLIAYRRQPEGRPRRHHGLGRR